MGHPHLWLGEKDRRVRRLPWDAERVPSRE
jgi:hypothetical protein